MPEVKIILSAETKQAVQAFNAFNLTTKQLQATTKTATAGLAAFNAVSLNFSGVVSPQLTTGIAAATMGMNSLREASTAANMSLGKMLGLVAAITGALALTKSASDLGDAQLGEAQSEAALADSNERLAASILKVVDARLKSQQISEAEAESIRKQVMAAKQQASNAEVQSALAGVNTGNRDTLHLMNANEFKDLRTTDIAEVQKSQLITEQITLGKSREVQFGLQLVTINDAIARIEERRRFNGEALAAGAIDAAERAKLDVADLREIVGLEQQRQTIVANRIANDFTKTDAEKFSQLDSMGMAEGVNPSSFTQNMQAGLAQLSSSWELAGNAARVAMDAMQLGVNGVTNGIMGAITGTMTWGQAFTQVARQIIASLIQIVVQWIAQQTIVRALRAVFTAESAVQANVTEQAWAPAAYAASVATYGYAAVVGAASVIAGLGTTMAAFMATGFADGGYTGDGPRDGIAGVVHYGEVVIPADMVDQVRRGQSFSSPIETTSAASSGSSNVSVKTVVVANMQDAILEAMKSPAGERVIVQTVDGRRLDLGFQT